MWADASFFCSIESVADAPGPDTHNQTSGVSVIGLAIAKWLKDHVVGLFDQDPALLSPPTKDIAARGFDPEHAVDVEAGLRVTGVPPGLRLKSLVIDGDLYQEMFKAGMFGETDDHLIRTQANLGAIWVRFKQKRPLQLTVAGNHGRHAMCELQTKYPYGKP